MNAGSLELRSIPHTAWLVALLTEASAVFGEGQTPWTDEELKSPAYWLALTHSLDDLEQRGRLLVELAAMADRLVLAEREPNE
jgi:hypothetical protein